MSKAAQKLAEDTGELDMTPMIDVVFNLLIFFMVVTDLTHKDLADLTLPLASQAVEDKADDPDGRIILNVDKFGQIHFHGQTVNLDELKAALKNEKAAYDQKMKNQGKSGLEDLPGGVKASKLFVLLRADKDTPWQHVQWLMTIMAEVGLYKMQFACKRYVDKSYRDVVAGGKEEWQILDGKLKKDDRTTKKGG